MAARRRRRRPEGREKDFSIWVIEAKRGRERREKADVAFFSLSRGKEWQDIAGNADKLVMLLDYSKLCRASHNFMIFAS